MNHRKRKQSENLRKPKKDIYKPYGYLEDPPGAKCPYCGEENKVCSHIDSLARAYGRGACAKKHNNIKIEDQK